MRKNENSAKKSPHETTAEAPLNDAPERATRGPYRVMAMGVMRSDLHGDMERPAETTGPLA